jgi:hypothetical protein
MRGSQLVSLPEYIHTQETLFIVFRDATVVDMNIFGMSSGKVAARGAEHEHQSVQLNGSFRRQHVQLVIQAKGIPVGGSPTL